MTLSDYVIESYRFLDGRPDDIEIVTEHLKRLKSTSLPAEEYGPLLLSYVQSLTRPWQDRQTIQYVK